MTIKTLQHTDLINLKSEHPELVIHDKINLAIDELFDIEYPHKKDSKTKSEVEEFGSILTNSNPDNWGSWVYYPWLNNVVHFPPKKELRALRTSRNRNLVTADEQLKLYDSTILVIGMSVGSNIVEALVSGGIGGKLILLDMDIIEPSNLNRIRSPYYHVGLHKVDAISQKAWEIDPYIEIIQYKDGLTTKNLEEILKDSNVDIVVDEMDDLRMKIILREYVKQHRLPLVMAADDGDDSLLDIERYDLDKNLKPFDGRIPDEIIEKIKNSEIPRAELGMIIGKYFIGIDNIPLRMYQSLAEVGKSLPSWPQLGGAAALSGVALAYSIKKILLGQKIKQGRTLISLDASLDLESLDPDHQNQLNNFKQFMTGTEK